MLKRQLRKGVERLVSKAGRQNWKASRPCLVILAYHRILPADYPEMPTVQPGMSVAPNTLRMHMALLKERFEPVHLADWLARRREGKSLPRKACAVTFDDGWRDNFDYALPILQDEQVPATIYLVSDKVATDDSYWPERLARLLWWGGEGPPDEIRDDDAFERLTESAANAAWTNVPARNEIDRIIVKAKRFDDAQIEGMLDRIEARLGKPPRLSSCPDLLDWTQVEQMRATGLIDFGSHTKRHRRLNGRLNDAELLDEIAGSKESIRELAGIEARTFCYPNGDVTSAGLELVKGAYIGACSTQSGWNTWAADPYSLKRISIHEDMADEEPAFLARLSGWV